MTLLTLGFSPCPNDTFLFAGLVNGWCANGASLFAPPLLEDVETLNRWAFERRLDVTKLSFHALGHVLDEYCVLAAGSALGRGCGPLLVTAGTTSVAALDGARIAIPGAYTTAAVLFAMFFPGSAETVEMRFDRILPAVATGEVAAGVIIHESRFTYRQLGLTCLQDLGQWWEDSTSLPIPLGCIAARRSLGQARLRSIEDQIRASLQFARRHPQRCRDYIRRHAQETEEAVIDAHIDLYVNDHTMDLGDAGRAAIAAFLKRGRASGRLPMGVSEPFCSGCG